MKFLNQVLKVAFSFNNQYIMSTSINKMVKLPYILLGYINTLTLAPCKNKSTPKLSETIKQLVEEKKTISMS